MESEKIQLLKRLRQTTDGSLSLCQEALRACNGDFDQAVEYIRTRQKPVTASPEHTKSVPQAPGMNHPVMGELYPSEMDAGWQGWITLPAFQSCYERWRSDGSERPDTRDQESRQGRFVVNFRSESPAPRVRRGRSAAVEPPPDRQPPSEGQVAAFEYLCTNQAEIAQELFTALVEEIPEVFPWNFERDDFLSAAVKQRLVTAEGMMGAVELQSVIIGTSADLGCARVGFGFHSELLEGEHGIGVIMIRNEVEVVSTCDELLDPSLTGP